MYATATTEIYTLSLHDALPIWRCLRDGAGFAWLGAGYCRPRYRQPVLADPVGDAALRLARAPPPGAALRGSRDRKSTRLNSSHLGISYAVFCLKKKKRTTRESRNSNPAIITPWPRTTKKRRQKSTHHK